MYFIEDNRWQSIIALLSLQVRQVNKWGNEMEIVTKSIRVDPELWHKAKVKALTEKTTMQDLIAKLLTEYLKKGGK
ncbi:MAG: hypothetical protein HGA74_18585 [Deltaproteobacteria bacterium]|jgi:hypothetical protein|nr:hypothetical protein [Deltaproteobacteria bacterium]